MNRTLFSLSVFFIVVLISNEGEGRGSPKPKIAPLKIIYSPNQILYVGQNYGFVATGGVPPYKFSVNIGTINASTGAYIAPSNPGVAIITVRDSTVKGSIASDSAVGVVTLKVPIYLNLHGVYKYYSVYPTSEGEIEAGKKNLPRIIHLFKGDGTFKSCMFDELKNKLDEEVSSKILKYKFDEKNNLIITKNDGKKVPLGYNQLSEAQIELTGATPLGVGSVGIRGITVALEKSEAPSGTSLDDYFNKSCKDLAIPQYLPPNLIANFQEYLNTYPCPSGRVPEITFSARQFYQGSGNTTQIQGQLQPTAVEGTASNTYVGVNTGTKDVIKITKMSAGGRVVGFNISLYLCRVISQQHTIYGGVGGYGPTNISIPIIDVARMPTVAGASPFIVTDPTNCVMGSVDQGTVALNIPAYQVPGTNVIIPSTQTQISFSRASCL